MKKKHLLFVAFSAALFACSENTDLAPLAAAENDPQANGTEKSSSSGKDDSSKDEEKSDSRYVCGLNTASSEEFCFDVVIRDFQSTHSDFENFAGEYSNVVNDRWLAQNSSLTGGARILAYGLPGYDMNWYLQSALHMTCGNKSTLTGAPLGSDGYPLVVNMALPEYLQKTSVATSTLKYGECYTSAIPGVAIQHGFDENVAVLGSVKNFTCSGRLYWGEDVFYTPGMVLRYLTVDNNEDGLDEAHVQKMNELCDNANFADWFADVENVNKRSEMTLKLSAASDDAQVKEVDYNHNNDGYFPLDKIDPTTGMRMGAAAGTDQWGAESFSIWCPPYDYPYAADQDDRFGQNTYKLCQDWLLYGGPKGLSQELAANIAEVHSPLGYQHLRNYHFTEEGFATFRYDAKSEGYIEAISIDDLWIFVDGVLAIDIGGDHQPAPGFVDLKTLAENGHGCAEGEPLASALKKAKACDENGWIDGSEHSIHFYYANRQTNGSHLTLRIKL